jgi:hypothetical protein
MQRPSRRPWQKLDQGCSEHVGLERVPKPTGPTLVVNLVPWFVVQEVEATHLPSVSIAVCLEIMLAWAGVLSPERYGR